MKKSEMVLRMTEHWLGLFPNEVPFDRVIFEEIKRNMSKLLEMMEDRGMYPPNTIIEGHDCTMWNAE